MTGPLSASFVDFWTFGTVMVATGHAQVHMTVLADEPVRTWRGSLLQLAALISIFLLVAVCLVYAWKVSILKAVLLVPAWIISGGFMGVTAGRMGLLPLLGYIGLVLGPLNGVMALDNLGLL